MLIMHSFFFFVSPTQKREPYRGSPQEFPRAGKGSTDREKKFPHFSFHYGRSQISHSTGYLPLFRDPHKTDREENRIFSKEARKWKKGGSPAFIYTIILALPNITLFFRVINKKVIPPNLGGRHCNPGYNLLLCQRNLEKLSKKCGFLQEEVRRKWISDSFARS